MSKQCEENTMSSHDGIDVIITAGATNEYFDADTRITNLNTGFMGAKIAEFLLTSFAKKIRTLYYISPSLCRKPVYNLGIDQAKKLKLIRAECMTEMLRTISDICYESDRVKLVIHSASISKYAVQNAIRAEDLADRILNTTNKLDKDSLIDMLENPDNAKRLDTAARIPAGGAAIMTMLTPVFDFTKELRKLAPDAKIFAFDRLSDPSPVERYLSASTMIAESRVDYVIAEDLESNEDDLQTSTVIGHDPESNCDAVYAEPNLPSEIAEIICLLAFPEEYPYTLEPKRSISGGRIRKFNKPGDLNQEMPDMGWTVTTQGPDGEHTCGEAADQETAWYIMLAEFIHAIEQDLDNGQTPIMLPPNDIDALDSWEYECLGLHQYAKIDADSAKVYNGQSVQYWNLSRISATEPDHEPKPEDTLRPWILCGADGTPLPGARPHISRCDAWLEMHARFSELLEQKNAKVPDANALRDQAWIYEDGSISANISPSAASIWDDETYTLLTLQQSKQESETEG